MRSYEREGGEKNPIKKMEREMRFAGKERRRGGWKI
jgi:hypothetical protein